MPHHSTQQGSPHPKFVRSPSSPTNLPYPPNPFQKEWWGRCFRCAQKGHVVAECTYPRMPAVAPTKDRSLGAPNPPALRPTAIPFTPAHQPRLSIFKSNSPEPGFDELLQDSESPQLPLLPSNRPRKALCYFNRDQQYFLSLQNSLKGIVVQPPTSLCGRFSLDKAAELVASSTKVLPTQLQVAWLTNNRVLVILPPSLNRDEVIMAIPRKIWDEGFTFHTYSPHIDAHISIPSFKVWIDLQGVPLHFCSDFHLARAVSSFGTYLGSMEPMRLGDVQNWSLFIATDDLALIPHELEFRAGGLVHMVAIRPKKWVQNPVYHRFDLPQMMISFQPPPPPPSPHSSSQTQTNSATLFGFDEDDVMPMSLKVLREVFKDVPRSDLPEELAACLAGDRLVIQANHDAYRRWEQLSGLSATVCQSKPNEATRLPATSDPMPSASITANPGNYAIPETTYPTLPAVTERPPTATATVHCTAPREN